MPADGGCGKAAITVIGSPSHEKLQTIAGPAVPGHRRAVPAANAWHHYVLDLTIGADHFDAWVDGIPFPGIEPASGPPVYTGTGLSVNDFSLAASIGTANYDNVTVRNMTASAPAFSSVALLVSGLAGLLAYSWRERK